MEFSRFSVGRRGILLHAVVGSMGRTGRKMGKRHERHERLKHKAGLVSASSTSMGESHNPQARHPSS